MSTLSKALVLLLLAGCVAVESGHAAVVAPSTPEEEKAVSDSAFIQRASAREAAVVTQRLQDQKDAAQTAEILALRNAPPPPEEDSFGIDESDRGLSREYSFRDVALAVGIATLIVALVGLCSYLQKLFVRELRKRQEAAAAALAKDADALTSAASMLDQRVESAEAVRQPDAAPVEAGAEAAPAGAVAAPAEPAIKRPKIGEVLVHMGQLLPEQLDKALKGAKAHHEKLGRYLLHTGMVTPEILCRALAMQSGLPIADLSKDEIPVKLTKKFTHAVMRANEFIPFREARTVICIAAANPLKHKLVEEFEAVCKKKIEVYLAEEDAILMLLDRVHRQQEPKLRKHSRVEVSVPLTFMFCNRMGAPIDDEEHEGMTLNLSEGGMLIEARGTITFPKDTHSIYVHALVSNGEGEDEDIQAVCQVRSKRKKQMPENATFNWLLGLELVEIEPAHQLRLKEICSSRTPVG